MFGNTRRIKELEREITRLRDDIYSIEERYIKEIQEVRKQAFKKENYAWSLQMEEVELIEQGKKVKKIIEILK